MGKHKSPPAPASAPMPASGPMEVEHARRAALDERMMRAEALDSAVQTFGEAINPSLPHTPRVDQGKLLIAKGVAVLRGEILRDPAA